MLLKGGEEVAGDEWEEVRRVKLKIGVNRTKIKSFSLFWQKTNNLNLKTENLEKYQWRNKKCKRFAHKNRTSHLDREWDNRKLKLNWLLKLNSTLTNMTAWVALTIEVVKCKNAFNLSCRHCLLNWRQSKARVYQGNNCFW